MSIARGIPGPLAGLLFSADGNLLYVVGASETATSALYAVPVTRNPATDEVTDLGPAAAVTKVFDGNPATALKKAARKMIGFSHRLRSLSSRKKIPLATRNALLAEAEPIRDDLKTLRKQL